MSTMRSPIGRLHYLLAGEATRAAMDGRAMPVRVPANTPPPNPHLVCPHCQTKGSVVRSSTTEKVGLSGGKVVAMILTAGLSLIFTGLSRKRGVTHAYCEVCRQHWTIS